MTQQQATAQTMLAAESLAGLSDADAGGAIWLDDNQQALDSCLALLRARLEAGPDAPGAAPDFRAPTLDGVRAAFGLSEFETALLLLCAGVELDSRMASLCAQLQGDETRAWPTFALAARLWPNSHWSALLPTGPLRYWRLIEMDQHRDVPLAQARLRIGERVLHHLTGLAYLDEPLHALMQVCFAPASLLPAHAEAARRIVLHMAGAQAGAFMLFGADAGARRDVMAQACAEVGARLFAMRAEDAPADPAERDALARLWMREALLSLAVLLIEGSPTPASMALAERIGTTVAISSREPGSAEIKRYIRVAVDPPKAAERRAWWRQELGARAQHLNGSLDALAAQFDLSPGDIALAIDNAENTSAEALWQTCRVLSRPRLDELAQRIEPGAAWDDLVLPPAQAALLRQLGARVRHRLKVYEEWGFGAARRGLGTSALFAGISGTGKTMAGEVLANELKLDLYRIDLSQVVSKYIGETEKNLRRVFDAAESGSVILLFDEADALFGKRSEVKDSHDRYANIEVSYLLQRMEEYRGLAILTTNQRGALDTAFLRRLSFIVEFPFPDAAMRAEIWRRVFPTATPTQGLEARKLAQLNVAGGNIRNIALNAAFIAAEAGESVGMRHVLHAARVEYAKFDKALSEVEVKEWV